MSKMLDAMLAEYQNCATEASSDENYEAGNAQKMLVFTDNTGKVWQISPVGDDQLQEFNELFESDEF